jgi:hypothetical protein
MNGPKLFLSLLICVLALSIVGAWFRMPRQKNVERLRFQQESTKSQQRSSHEDKPVELRLDLLDQKQAAAVVTRNVFKPPGNSPVNIMAGTRQRNMPVVVPPPPPPPTAQEIASKQLAAFTVIGSYFRKNTRIVFLARGEEILSVRTGDFLMSGYSVVDIQDEQLKLRSDDGKHELILALSGR